MQKVGRLLVAVAALALLASLVYSGIHARQQNNAELNTVVAENSWPAVSVGHPLQGENGTIGTFPANIQASVETPIYARTNGYLKRWMADIGTHVNAGQALAEIDTPEVDQQLKQAEATVAAAQATLDLDRTTATRYQQLLKQDGVSEQEVDHALGTMH